MKELRLGEEWDLSELFFLPIFIHYQSSCGSVVLQVPSWAVGTPTQIRHDLWSLQAIPTWHGRAKRHVCKPPASQVKPEKVVPGRTDAGSNLSFVTSLALCPWRVVTPLQTGPRFPHLQNERVQQSAIRGPAPGTHLKGSLRQSHG